MTNHYTVQATRNGLPTQEAGVDPDDHIHNECEARFVFDRWIKEMKSSGTVTLSRNGEVIAEHKEFEL